MPKPLPGGYTGNGSPFLCRKKNTTWCTAIAAAATTMGSQSR